MRAEPFVAASISLLCLGPLAGHTRADTMGAGLQRFVDANSATFNAHCDQAVEAGGVVLTAIINKQYAIAVKVGQKAVGWLTCEVALPRLTRWAQQGRQDPPPTEAELHFLDAPLAATLAARGPELVPLQLLPATISVEQDTAIRALPTFTIQPLGSYTELRRKLDAIVPPGDPPSIAPRPGAWTLPPGFEDALRGVSKP